MSGGITGVPQGPNYQFGCAEDCCYLNGMPQQLCCGTLLDIAGVIFKVHDTHTKRLNIVMVCFRVGL